MVTDVICIAPGIRVTMHFSLNLENGEVVDSTSEEPASFIVGDGRLPAGIEQQLLGLVPGDQVTLKILPEHAFGQHNSQNVHRISVDQFSSEISLETGTVIYFADKSGKEMPGVIRSYSGDTVEVDFNHPLAGLNLLLDVDILDLCLA